MPKSKPTTQQAVALPYELCKAVTKHTPHARLTLPVTQIWHVNVAAYTSPWKLVGTVGRELKNAVASQCAHAWVCRTVWAMPPA
eukprot:6039627-Pleurochrysis_carterae.AAC.2